MGQIGEVGEKGLESLKVWHRARGLMVAVHKQVVPRLPAEEKWDLAKQIRRSSKSVAANIAEGHGRYYYQQGVFFCYIARGSLDETINHLVTAFELEYISKDLYHEVRAIADETRRMLNGYIAYLKKCKQGETEPGSQLAASDPRIASDHNNQLSEE
jgi:four helix bundle protein